MNELDPLEKQLQSWTPRRPSAEIAERLFGTTEAPRPVARRTTFAWNWLAPAAACFLAMLVVVGNWRPAQMDDKSQSSFFATVMVDAATRSNLDGRISTSSFALNKEDINLQWNIWLRPNLKTTNLSSDFASFNDMRSATNQ